MFNVGSWQQGVSCLELNNTQAETGRVVLGGNPQSGFGVAVGVPSKTNPNRGTKSSPEGEIETGLPKMEVSRVEPQKKTPPPIWAAVSPASFRSPRASGLKRACGAPALEAWGQGVDLRLVPQLGASAVGARALFGGPCVLWGAIF